MEQPVQKMQDRGGAPPGGTRLAVGFFDGVHAGHRRILAGADAVLTFANHPLSGIRGRTPPPLLMAAGDRLALLASAWTKSPRKVDALEFTEEFAAMPPGDFASFLKRRYPRLERIHCGPNWRFGAGGAGTPPMLRAAGIPVKICRYAKYKGEAVSSTRIREALSRGEVEDANAMLGRPFSVSGPVLRGKGEGRALGAPTINIATGFPLRRGVYAVETPLWAGVANFGTAPTMGSRAWREPVLEVHLLEEAVPPAAASLSVSFVKFVREETAFASKTALRERIAADIASARRYFAGKPCGKTDSVII